MEALHDVVRAGKARYLGASSMYAWQFATAQYTADLTAGPGSCPCRTTTTCSTARRSGRCTRSAWTMGVGVIPWSPLARGMLAGTRTRDERATTRSRSDTIADRLYTDDDFAVVDAVRGVADARGLPPAQVALAWLLHQPVLTAPIVGATKPGHIEDAVAAVDIELSDEEIAALEAPYVPHPVLGHRDPRAVVIAAPASGSGKTTVATGLMAALRRRGTAVAPFKVGPDYIDPGYHTLAAGRPGRNLDPVLVGADRIAPLARHGAAGAELAVVEGVMGLFDGRLADGAGSTAQVAALLGAPVVLVVDVRGQSRSLAALLHGFRTFDAGSGPVRLAGVILNRVGSARHEQVLRAAAAEVGLPVLGALPRRDALAVPSRHLGLITAAEHGAAATAAVDAMAELVGRARRPGRGGPAGRAAAARPGLGSRS